VRSLFLSFFLRPNGREGGRMTTTKILVVLVSIKKKVSIKTCCPERGVVKKSVYVRQDDENGGDRSSTV